MEKKTYIRTHNLIACADNIIYIEQSWNLETKHCLFICFDNGKEVKVFYDNDRYIMDFFNQFKEFVNSKQQENMRK